MANRQGFIATVSKSTTKYQASFFMVAFFWLAWSTRHSRQTTTERIYVFEAAILTFQTMIFRVQKEKDKVGVKRNNLNISLSEHILHTLLHHCTTVRRTVRQSRRKVQVMFGSSVFKVFHGKSNAAAIVRTRKKGDVNRWLLLQG